ncbi:TetR/AcrR family transcriptional regulator C-terminal domain-containing protein [Streptomyces sp. PA5.6]|uniref:TetR/AcrR family transcriptional regulator C-terminal domain-containing protein n=1 Tax=Streptomyces sp. PA5.6 TaxID=3035651 RepID=UPI003904AC99
MVKVATTKLDRTRVARTALDLLNETGLEGLTLRAIAQRLDVKAPALYWHFKDKQALLDEMATEMMRRMSEDFLSAPDADWRVALTAAMRGLRAHLLRYRDGAKVFSGTHYTDLSYAAPMEAHLRVLAGAGFAPDAAARAWFTVYNYTIGFVIEEQAAGPAPGRGEGGYDLAARAERLAAYPLAAAAGDVMFRSHDRGFDEGLATIVTGIGARLATSTGSERGSG